MTTTRRDLLVCAAATVVGAMTADIGAATPAETSLQSMAAAKGMRFGSCIGWSPPGADSGSFTNPAYAGLVLRECGIVVAENEMKWPSIRPSATAFDFTKFDTMLAWAEAHGLAMRGHNLLWLLAKWMPEWEERYDFGNRPGLAAERIIERHINTVCARYGRRIGSYDVVNEAINFLDGTPYETALSRAMGGIVPAMEHAFRTARSAAPHAELLYNDFMSWEPRSAKHRLGVLRLLETLKKRDVPIDAVGFQSHIATQGIAGRGGAQVLEQDWRRYIDEIAAMGYGIVVTELDVTDDNLPADPTVRDQAVAAYTKAYLDVMLSYPVRDVLVWGMTDRYNWLESYVPRADHARRRPHPYDDQFVAKPMRTAIASALATAPRRT